MFDSRQTRCRMSHSFRPAFAALLVALLFFQVQGAGVAAFQNPEGRILFPVVAGQASINSRSKPITVSPATLSTGESIRWDFVPTRWGRYDLRVDYVSGTSETRLRVEIAGQNTEVVIPAGGKLGQVASFIATRIYLAQSNPFSLVVTRLDSGKPPLLLRSVTLEPAPEGNPIQQAADRAVTLHSRDATTHSVMMRYEPAPQKNCLGYWVNVNDWADWQFSIHQPGNFEVEVWQGCGWGHGGSDVVVEVDGQRCPFVVEETGHFQNFVPRQVGRVTLGNAGAHTLAIRPQRKQGGAVMDIRQIRLVPARTPLEVAPPVRDFLAARRVVVVGDSITYSGGWVEWVEAWLHGNYPEVPVQFINVGLPSETASGLSEPGHAGGSFPRPDLHERLERLLQKMHPDLIVACYGMNDGIYHPFSEDRFLKFQEGMRRLHERAAHEGIRVIHLTPPVFDPLPLTGRTLPAGLREYPSPYEGYNGVLDRYSEWLVSQRKVGWEVIDLHGPMNRFIAEKRRMDPKFTLAGDGVHANAQGHWIMAREVLRRLGAPGSMVDAESPDLVLQAFPQGRDILALVQKRQGVLKDAWLTEVGHLRPGMSKGKPLAEAEKEAARLTDALLELR